MGQPSHYRQKAKEVGKTWIADGYFMYFLSITSYLSWPLMAMICLAGILSNSYNDANLTYANVFTYSTLMPSAGHLFAISSVAFMYIYYGVSEFRFSPKEGAKSDTQHMLYLIPCFPLVAGAISALCVDQPWVTFGLYFGALGFALASYVSKAGLISWNDLTGGGLASESHVRAKNQNGGKPYSLVSAFFYKFPVKLFIVFLVFETLQAFMGAATLTDADLGWKKEHWCVVLEVVTIVVFANLYFLYYEVDAVIGYIMSGFLIQLALAQRDDDPTGYLWIVSLSVAVFEAIASTITASFVLNLIAWSSQEFIFLEKMEGKRKHGTV